jgi:hypothetical protein
LHVGNGLLYLFPDTKHVARSDVGEGHECGPCGGVVGYDDALARGISEVLMFEGREEEAKMCLQKSMDSDEATKTFESRLGVLFELHDKLYSKMREASPNDSAMGNFTTAPALLSLFVMHGTLLDLHFSSRHLGEVVFGIK